MQRPLNYVLLSKEAFKKNISIARDLINPSCELCAVIKANAYGHGAKEVISIIDSLVDSYQIDDIEEYLEIKEHTKKPIYILGYVSPLSIKFLDVKKVTIAVLNLKHLKDLEDAAISLNCNISAHIAIDAYFGREGLVRDEWQDFLNLAKKCSHINFTGIYAHLSSVDSDLDGKITEKQYAEFEKAKLFFNPILDVSAKTHFEATPGLLKKSNTKHSMVRFGIGLYGLLSKQSFNSNLIPALSLHTHIAQVKTLPENYPIGYNQTYTTKSRQKIALLPFGYSDGFSRSLSNKGFVLIKGVRAQILGRISMNMMVVDLSNITNAIEGDEVVIIGAQNGEIITADEITALCDSINYEITTKIPFQIPKIIV